MLLMSQPFPLGIWCLLDSSAPQRWLAGSIPSLGNGCHHLRFHVEGVGHLGSVRHQRKAQRVSAAFLNTLGEVLLLDGFCLGHLLGIQVATVQGGLQVLHTSVDSEAEIEEQGYA